MVYLHTHSLEGFTENQNLNRRNDFIHLQSWGPVRTQPDLILYRMQNQNSCTPRKATLHELVFSSLYKWLSRSLFWWALLKWMWFYQQCWPQISRAIIGKFYRSVSQLLLKTLSGLLLVCFKLEKVMILFCLLLNTYFMFFCSKHCRYQTFCR